MVSRAFSSSTLSLQ